ncbi:MAG: hypothetical protein RLZZ299_1853 [Pseudomonadota bacterium]
MNPTRAWAATERAWAPVVAVLLVVMAAWRPLVLDEEGYLWIARHLDPARPYDWTRAWPPWDAADSFVYAHPPGHLLWCWALRDLQDTLPLLRVVAGAPWAALTGWAVLRLARETCHHPHRATAAWLGSAIVVLGLQDSLMIDLPATALVTAALACWRTGARDSAPRPDGWTWAAGALLGAAVCTKYSMGVFAPVLLAHALRMRWRGGLLALGLALGVVVAVEGWLAARYGRLHLAEVWARRGEIAAGDTGARVLGTLARAALLPLPLVVLRARPALAAGAGLLAMGALLAERPGGLGFGQAGALLGAAFLGALVGVRALEAGLRGATRRRRGDRDDAFLLGGWTLAGMLGVMALHNYASARYLLPVAAPAAMLLGRAAEEVRGGKALLAATTALGALLAGVMGVAEGRYARATEDVARQALAHVAAATRSAGATTRGAAVDAMPAGPGALRGRAEPPPQTQDHGPVVIFAGEWGFRAVMERHGATRLVPGRPLPPCAWLVTATHASPGEVPPLEPVARVESMDRFWLRVVDVHDGIGLYAETLGPLPFGTGNGPLESATLARTPCPTP